MHTTLRAMRSGGVFLVEDGKKELVISFIATHITTQSIDKQIKSMFGARLVSKSHCSPAGKGGIISILVFHWESVSERFTKSDFDFKSFGTSP